MKNKLVKITIMSIDKELAVQLKEAITKENRYFKKIEIGIINSITKVKSTNILVMLSNQEPKIKVEKAWAMLKGKLDKVIAVNVNDELTYEISENTKGQYKSFSVNYKKNSFGKIIDINPIAFSIVFEYYQLVLEKEESMKKTLNKTKYQEKMEKYDQYEHKKILSKNIDEIIMEDQKHGFTGYKELKTMIIFCMINQEKIQYDKNYIHIEQAMSEILNERWNAIRNVIDIALGTIARKKKELKIQPILTRLKGRPVSEKIIIISRIVVFDIKNKYKEK